ncbi:outer membrane beta-barrel family protein [Flavivirga jejuensis]
MAQNGELQIQSEVSKIGVVQGTIIDKSGKEPVVFATVIIKNKKDKKILTGGMTDSKGNFKVRDLPEGEFILEIQFIGYKTETKEFLISSGNKRLNFGIISIEESIQELDTVKIVLEKSTIEQRVDRKVINVGKDLMTAGASASEIMNNIPSVTVDSQSGNLSFRGNDNVRVMIDGKPSNLNTAQLLKQIPSTAIKKIELITSPSAKYNPEGMSGIINIVLHKNNKSGLNGKFNSGLIKRANTIFNNFAALNYRGEKINVYGNYSNNIGKNLFSSVISKEIDNSTQFSALSFGNNNHLYKIGLDYYINDKKAVSIYTNQTVASRENTMLADIIYNLNDQPNSELDFNNNITSFIGSYNFIYKQEFDKEGHTLDIEADYNALDNEEDAANIFSLKEDFNEFIKDKRTTTIINLDYSNPLSKTSKLELGAEYRMRRTTNKYLNDNVLLNSEYNNDRDILSAYGIYSKDLDKWFYQLGIRIEQYEEDTYLNKENQPHIDFSNEIFNLFPSGALRYNPNDKNSYRLNVSRRVDRPRLDQLNPIRQFANLRFRLIGNPYLKLQFTNSIELNYIKQIKKGSINTNVFYRKTKNEIARNVFLDPNDSSGDEYIISYLNYDANNSFGLEMSLNYKPVSWWNFNAGFDLYSTKIQGTIDDELFEGDRTVFNFRFNSNVNITKSLTLSAFMLYQGPDQRLQSKKGEVYFVNLGLSQTFLNKNATANLNFNNLFRSLNFDLETHEALGVYGRFKGESNFVSMNFSYRFGNRKNKGVSRKKRDKKESDSR